MRMRLPSLVATATLALALGSGAAMAFPLYPGAGNQSGTLIEDDDLDYHVDVNQNGLIDVGDRLVAVLDFTKIQDTLPPAGSPYVLDQDADELVALSIIEVIANEATDPAGRIRFGQYLDTPMVSFYTGGPTDLALGVLPDPTMADAINAVIDGTFLWSFSIDPLDPDTEWFFDGPVGANNPAAVKLINAGTKVGTVNFALNQVAGNDIFSLQAFGPISPFAAAGDGMVDMIGSADILGGAGLTNAFARSDADTTLNVVPEPATLGLMGMGLLGLAGLGRRRSLKSK